MPYYSQNYASIMSQGLPSALNNQRYPTYLLTFFLNETAPPIEEICEPHCVQVSCFQHNLSSSYPCRSSFQHVTLPLVSFPGSCSFGCIKRKRSRSQNEATLPFNQCFPPSSWTNITTFIYFLSYLSASTEGRIYELKHLDQKLLSYA